MVKATKKKESRQKAFVNPESLTPEESNIKSKKYTIFLCIVLFVGFGVYSNTLFHEYAFDDGMAITDNSFTQQGFSGIKDILTNDSFVGVKGSEGELTGGRYRPLSIVSFAIEKEFFGNNTFISHLNNVLLFCLLLYFIYIFSYQYLFNKSELKAFFTSLIFAVHPIHTEVVANLKSRDEIMSFLLILISLFSLFKSYSDSKLYLKYTLIACVSYFMALLSKENGITYIAIFPMSMYFIKKKNIQDSLKSVVPFLTVAMLYLLIRYNVVGIRFSKSLELMNAPFLLANDVQAIATKTFILLKYLILLFFPYPLSYDYSFNQIPYLNGDDYRFWLSILIHAGLIYFALVSFKKRSLVSYSILFYLATISIVSNFIFDVGATMGERFLFQPSFAFAIVSGIFLNYMYEKADKGKRKYMVIPFIALIVLSASSYTIARNTVWKNDYTLFMNGIKNAPNSAKVYVYAGVVMIKSVESETDTIKKADVLRKSILNFEKSLTIYPRYTDAYLNMGVAYSNLNEKEKAMECWEKANEISPGHFLSVANLKYLSDWYLKKAVSLFEVSNIDDAIKYTEIAIRCNKANSLAWYNLGGYWMMKGNTEKAREYWTQTLEIDPNYTQAKEWLGKIQ